MERKRARELKRCHGEEINRRRKWMTRQKRDERWKERVDKRCDEQKVRDRGRESQREGDKAGDEETERVSCTCGYPC